MISETAKRIQLLVSAFLNSCRRPVSVGEKKRRSRLFGAASSPLARWNRLIFGVCSPSLDRGVEEGFSAAGAGNWLRGKI